MIFKTGMTENQIVNVSAIIAEKMKAKNISLERLSFLTGVSERYLKNILNRNAADLPPAPYLKGYSEKLAEVLDLDGEALWAEFRAMFAQERRRSDRTATPRLLGKPAKSLPLKTSLMVAALCLAAGFVFARFRSLDNPNLKFQNLKEDITIVETKNFTVLGSLDTAYTVLINGEQVLTDSTGQFSKSLSLEPGFNTVRFSTKRFLGRERETVKQIFYNESASPPPAPLTPPGTDPDSTTDENQ